MQDATYIWVAGGSFSVGTEARPFTHQATITLHGDRWKTVELPFIGAKVLAVTNRGGLTTACHKHTISTENRFNAEGPRYFLSQRHHLLVSPRGLALTLKSNLKYSMLIQVRKACVEWKALDGWTCRAGAVT